MWGLKAGEKLPRFWGFDAALPGYKPKDIDVGIKSVVYPTRPSRRETSSFTVESLRLQI